MSIKENFQKIRDKIILKKEIKCAKRMMLENSDNNSEKKEKSIKILKINRQKLKDTGLVVGAVVLIGIGYVNFTESKSEITEETSSSGYSEYGNNLGDVQLVNGEVDEETENNIEEEQENLTEDLESEDELEENSEEDESILETLATTDLNAYFTELKLKRDNIYSEKLEAYEQIAQSDSISSEQKAIAIQEIENITETQNAIAVAEELIKLKGFENVIIYVNNNSISVIVRSAVLSLEEVAQIQNIILREFDVEISEISISSK